MTLEEFVEAKIKVEKERIDNFAEAWKNGLRDEVIKALASELPSKGINVSSFEDWEDEMKDWGYEF